MKCVGVGTASLFLPPCPQPPSQSLYLSTIPFTHTHTNTHTHTHTHTQIRQHQQLHVLVVGSSFRNYCLNEWGLFNTVLLDKRDGTIQVLSLYSYIIHVPTHADMHTTHTNKEYARDAESRSQNTHKHTYKHTHTHTHTHTYTYTHIHT